MKIRLHVPTIGIATKQFAKCVKMEVNVASSIVNKHVMLMCCVATSGSTVESLHCIIEAFLVDISGVGFAAGRVGVQRASVGISGVCFVAGRLRVERFLDVLPWSNGLFPIELIARNDARKAVGKPKELWIICNASLLRGSNDNHAL